MMKMELEYVIQRNLKFPENSNIQQRGIADKIEDACNEIIKKTFDDVKDARSRRSVEDICVGDTYVDHKTSDISLNFKMPNLISIDRLLSLKNSLLYNFVIYDSKNKEIVKVFVLNIYELNWDCLHIQNLGAGQLQIANMEKFMSSPKFEGTKEEWIEILKIKSIEFYDKLIAKTMKRKKKWENINK
jgi:hypothetical protein